MTEDLPDWEALVALLRSPKPRLRATVYAMGKDPARVDLGAEDPGPAWAAAWVDPARLAVLSRSTGRAVGHDREAGRDRWIAEVTGLKGRSPVKVWVDAGTGSIVRLERLDDPAPLVVVEGLEAGG